MSSRELLLSQMGGFRETIIFDESDPSRLMIKTYEDSEALKEHARCLSDQVPGKDFRHAAVIPKQVLDQAFREGWANDKRAWKRWANDSANAHLRTWNGRL